LISKVIYPNSAVYSKKRQITRIIFLNFAVSPEKRLILKVIYPNSAVSSKKRQITRIIFLNFAVSPEKRLISKIIYPNSAVYSKKRQITRIIFLNFAVSPEKKLILKVIYPNSAVYSKKRQITVKFKFISKQVTSEIYLAFMLTLLSYSRLDHVVSYRVFAAKKRLPAFSTFHFSFYTLHKTQSD